MDPTNSKDVKRLMGAVKASFDSLEKPRQSRKESLDLMVGTHWFNDGASDRQPMNLMELATTIYTQQLVGTAPMVLCSTTSRPHKAECLDFECLINHKIKELDVESTLRECVIESLFGMGIIKVGIADKGVQDLENWSFEANEVYADVVLFEDFVFDVTAKRPRNCRFMGHKFRIPLEAAKENRLFDKEGRKKLVAASKSQERTIDADESATALTDENLSDCDEYEDHVELWELWLPFENLIITIACDGDDRMPLRVEEWEGPEHGPYHLLGLNDVTGNVLPLPPTAVWRDLHEIVNQLYNKNVRKAKNSKTVFFYNGADDQMAETVRTAGDGAFVKNDSPQGITPAQIGNVDNNILALQMNAEAAFSKQAGNLDLIGGLGAQTNTVGQEKILAESSSERMKKYQRQVALFTQRVLEDLAYHIWHDPMPPQGLSRRIPGVPIDIPVNFSKEYRSGKVEDYKVEIVPYSLQMKGPEERLAFVTNTLTNLLLPSQPMLEQQGISINFQALLEQMSQYANVPELLDILTFTGPPRPGMESPAAPPPRPPAAESGPSARSGGGRSDAGQSKIMQQALVGGRPQASEMRAVGA